MADRPMEKIERRRWMQLVLPLFELFVCAWEEKGGGRNKIKSMSF